MIAFMMWTVVVMFAAAVLLLVLPIRLVVRVSGDTDAGFRALVKIMPFAGLVGAGVEHSDGETNFSAYLGTLRFFSADAGPFVRRGRPKRKAKEPDKKTGTPPEETPEPIPGRIENWMVKAREYRYYAGTGVRAVRTLVRVDRWKIRVRFGLGDPGLTGQLAGFVYALNGALPGRFTIVPEWDFTHKTCAGEVEAVFTFRTHMQWVVLVREIRAYLARRKEWAVQPGKSASPQEA